MELYIHKTEQRLRVRSDFIRQNPKAVAELIDNLKQIDAIESIKHKVFAGSVAITFDKQELDCESLLEILESHGWTQERERASFVENAVTAGTKTLARGVASLALQRLVGASMSRLLLAAR